MAPRGRSRKPRQGRIHAAIDAMVPLGFPEQLVRKRVQLLLQVYGGDDGWPFIEADAYRLLIDNFLDEQEKEVKEEESNEGENSLEDAPSQDERAGDNSKAVDVGPSALVLASTSSASGVADTTTQTSETGGGHILLPAEGAEKDLKHVDVRSGQGSEIDNNPLLSPPPASTSPLPITSIPTRRRKPCHGWISSDDDDDLDMIYLTPAVPVGSKSKMRQSEIPSSCMDKEHKRNSRWDERPGGP